MSRTLSDEQDKRGEKKHDDDSRNRKKVIMVGDKCVKGRELRDVDIDLGSDLGVL